MLNVHRIKKTNQIVHVIGKADSGHSFVLFPFNRIAKSGDRGVVQSVRNDNLVEDKSS